MFVLDGTIISGWWNLVNVLAVCVYWWRFVCMVYPVMCIRRWHCVSCLQSNTRVSVRGSSTSAASPMWCWAATSRTSTAARQTEGCSLGAVPPTEHPPTLLPHPPLVISPPHSLQSLVISVPSHSRCRWYWGCLRVWNHYVTTVARYYSTTTVDKPFYCTVLKLYDPQANNVTSNLALT